MSHKSLGVLVFAYYSFKDPVFQSAVLPYIKRLHFTDRKIVLLTWEQPQYRLGREEEIHTQSQLANEGIFWYKTTWRSGRFKLFKKGFDFLWGIILSLKLIFQYKVSTIYTEGFPGAVIGHYLSLLSGRKHIVHTFEPHADYMVDAGVWEKSSWEYRLLKKLEVPIANRASTIITATEAYKEVLLKRGVKTQILIIPSCIDLDFYKFNPAARKEIRDTLAISEDTLVVVYLGKLGGMYMDEEIFAFWKSCLDYAPDRFFFFLLSSADPEEVDYWCHKYNIPSDNILFKYLQKEDVPSYLSAADVGFCAVRPIPSQRYSSPIKTGEYWACGLPVILTKGVSDDYLLIQDNGVNFSFSENYHFLAPKLLEAFLNEQNWNDLKLKARAQAKQQRDLKKAVQLLRQAFE